MISLDDEYLINSNAIFDSIQSILFYWDEHLRDALKNHLENCSLTMCRLSCSVILEIQFFPYVSSGKDI